MLTLALSALVVVAAVVSGLSMVGGDRLLAVLPIVAVVALALGALAATEFSGFVLLLLAVRPTLDLFKLSAAGTGTTEGNTAATRGLDPSAIVGVLFLLAAIIWLTGRMRSGRAVPASRLRIALLVFLAACVLSVLGAGHPASAALEALRIATVVMMFVVLEQLITSDRMMNHVLAACYVALAIPLVYTAFTFLVGGPASEVKGSYTRLTGPFNQSNVFARYLAFLIIFGVAIYPHVRPALKKVLVVLLGVSALFLLLTLTRTAILGAGLALVVLAVVQRRRGLGIALVVVAVLSLVALPGVGSRLTSFESDQQLSLNDPNAGNTLEWRLQYWTEVLPLANRNPISGIGLNETQYETDAAKQPHNDFIRAYVETGLIGLGAYLATLVALIGNATRALRRTRVGSYPHAVAAGSLACGLALVFGSVAANVMSNVVVLWYVYAFAAATSYVSRTAAAASPGAVAGRDARRV